MLKIKKSNVNRSQARAVLGRKTASRSIKTWHAMKKRWKKKFKPFKTN